MCLPLAGIMSLAFKNECIFDFLSDWYTLPTQIQNNTFALPAQVKHFKVLPPSYLKSCIIQRDTIIYKRSSKSFCDSCSSLSNQGIFSPHIWNFNGSNRDNFDTSLCDLSFSSVTLVSTKAGCPSHVGNSESYQNSSILNYLLSYSNFLLFSMDSGSCLSAQPTFPLFP